MRKIELPYDTGTLPLHVDEKNLRAVLINNAPVRSGEPEDEIVRKALEAPIGTPRLSELSRGKKRVLLVTSDHTRAMPSRITLPLLLAEIRSGNPDAEITIMIATGLHRKTTREEQIRMFGEEIVNGERIVVHDAFDKESCVFVCGLPSGSDFWVNRAAAEADMIVCEGFIEPHFFAGFSGGRKSILPGIAAAETVNENHSFKAVAHKNSRAGILGGNVISDDMLFAAKKMNVAFIMNVALDENKKIIAAFAGDLEAAHDEGCAFAGRMAAVKPVSGDIVITSNGGYPLDQNLYQAPKSASTAESCAKEGAVIILVCKCRDGLGGTHFDRLMRMGTPEEIQAYLSGIPPKESIPEQWCVQIFSQMLMKHRIILVSDGLSDETIRAVNMIPARTPDEALAMAYEMKGADAGVVVIPDGVAVIACEV